MLDPIRRVFMDSDRAGVPHLGPLTGDFNVDSFPHKSPCHEDDDPLMAGYTPPTVGHIHG